jgi:hypothetical protein
MIAALGGAAALVAAAAAWAGDVQTFQVAAAGEPATAGFAPDVALMIESPAAYVAQSPGMWAGPAAQTGTATMGWAVTFRDRTTDPATTAAAANTNGWPLDQKYGISIPLYVSGRFVGTLPGYAVITQSGGDARGRFEASLAVPLGAGAQAVVHYTTPTPATDTNLVDGFLASTWNRGQIFQALALVRVQGNLAPKTISVRLDARRSQLFGRVVDPFFNPLVGVAVVEQRWNGTGWRKVSLTHTKPDGTYRVAAAAGRLRTVVVSGATSLASAEVRR